MKTKGDVIVQDGQVITRHRVDPSHALRAAELSRQAQGNRIGTTNLVGQIPAAVFYGFAKERFGLSPREALKSHEALLAFLNDPDYSKFLSHDRAGDLINQSFGEGEA